MTNNTIPITVLMSVYNGENFLEEAIGSILKQTFSNFEFIIIDDGSGECEIGDFITVDQNGEIWLEPPVGEEIISITGIVQNYVPSISLGLFKFSIN